MLLNLHKKSWVDGLTLEDYSKHCTTNENTVKEMLELAKNYHKVCLTVTEKLSGICYLLSYSFQLDFFVSMEYGFDTLHSQSFVMVPE